MICQECHERPATLHLTKVIGGEKTEVHLCEHCAQEKGEWVLHQEDFGFSFHQLLSGLLQGNTGFQESSHPLQPGKESQKVCSGCGMTYTTFKHKGKFGCATCYETFRQEFPPIVKRLHGGNTQHHGKIPKRSGESLQRKKQVALLKEDMQTAISREEFEHAAEIRDRIRSMESFSPPPDERGKE
ncbi:UvrB/UvrC motif-containing protein [Bacillus fonticola]|uniref:UvrB/UvrC motif-containing protein n=1 Tax=Bacillus fonticola TaxID=2728853 RepID=UPI0014728184|nr:UvrB/UvrC motif-containing protein [Bacillus fonticola]